MSTKHELHGHFCWNELMTRDMAQARTFYAELLGWSYKDDDSIGFTYTTAQKDGEDVCGMMVMPEMVPQEVPSHWGSFVSVNDVEAAVDKVETLGGTVLQGATKIEGVGSFCIIQDPSGAFLNLMQFEKQ